MLESTLKLIEAERYVLSSTQDFLFVIASLILWSPIGQFPPSCLLLDREPVNHCGFLRCFGVARRGWQPSRLLKHGGETPVISKKQPTGTMKIANLAVYGFALVLLAVGLRELLTGFEENRCSMTYMFEYPEYRVRKQANISFNTSTRTFSKD